MPATDYLINTNILIYHTQGSQKTINFITSLVAQHSFYISILTKIEFLGWDKHTPDLIKIWTRCEYSLKRVLFSPDTRTRKSLSTPPVYLPYPLCNRKSKIRNPEGVMGLPAEVSFRPELKPKGSGRAARGSPWAALLHLITTKKDYLRKF